MNSNVGLRVRTDHPAAAHSCPATLLPRASIPAKEIGLFDVCRGVTVAAVSEFVVVAALPQHHLILRDGVLAARGPQPDGATPLLVFSCKDNTFPSAPLGEF